MYKRLYHITKGWIKRVWLSLHLHRCISGNKAHILSVLALISECVAVLFVIVWWTPLLSPSANREAAQVVWSLSWYKHTYIYHIFIFYGIMFVVKVQWMITYVYNGLYRCLSNQCFVVLSINWLCVWILLYNTDRVY